jgi:hypothetical protein
MDARELSQALPKRGFFYAFCRHIGILIVFLVSLSFCEKAVILIFFDGSRPRLIGRGTGFFYFFRRKGIKELPFVLFCFIFVGKFGSL